MRISAIIPSFNRDDQTQQAVQSVLAQSPAVHEVVVVDDGSTPPIEIKFAQGTSVPVRLVRLDRNAGPAHARNVGVAAAEGEIIAFLDSDDLWLEGKLASQLEVLLAEPDGRGPVAVSCGWEQADARGRLVTRIPLGTDNPRDFESGCWFCPGSTIMMRKADFERVGPFDERLRRLEDYEWFLRFARAGGRLRVVPTKSVYINKGPTIDKRHVEEAAAIIWQTYVAPGGDGARNIASWLYLERAATAFHHQQWGELVVNFGRSLALKPRLQIHHRRWWSGTSSRGNA